MPYRTVEKGDRISEYVLEEKLGEGGLGEVWKARHAETPARWVAIKFPKSPDHVQRIRNEAFLQSPLSHPNIVKTVGHNLDGDPPYVVTEFVDGKDLRTLINTEGIVPPPYAIDIAAQILDGLQVAHEKSLVHHDIKPENILVDKKSVELKDGRRALLYWVKITDLGLGRALFESERGGSPGVGLGSAIFYRAPEQMNPNLKVDRRADLYSVGVLLYEMLTGILPLGMDLPSELNPVVPKELDRIVKHALCVDRDLRYSTAAEMRDDLARAKEAFLRGLREGRVKLGVEYEGADVALQREIPGHAPAAPDPKPAPAMPLLQRVKRLQRMERSALLVAGSVIVTLLALLFFIFASKPAAPPPAVNGPKTADFAAIKLTTEPDGVEVFLDGVNLGVTPIQIAPVSFEPHEIRLKYKFHRDRVLQLEPRQTAGRRHFRVRDPDLNRELFALEFSETAVIERLLLDRLTGTLGIETPGVDGVKVYLNDEFHGTTPLTVKKLAAGVYQLALRKDGYKTVERPIEVLGDSRITHSISVAQVEPEPAAPPPQEQVCELMILTEPDGAKVTVDGEEQPGWTPIVLRLAPGMRKIRIDKPYHEPREFEMDMAGRGVQLRFPLSRLRGPIHVISEPTGARVFLNDQLYGTTPLRADGIEAGTYQVRIEKEGHRVHTQTVEVKGPEGAVYQVTLPAAEPSAVRVRAAVPGLAIYFDQGRVGKTGEGWTRFATQPGKHRVVVGGAPYDIDVPDTGEAMVEASETDLGLAWVEGGSFRFGAKEAQGNVAVKERLVHLTGYWIDRHEVTNARYRVFLEYMAATKDHSMCHRGEGESKDHTPKAQYWRDSNFNGDEQPVVGVDYYDAWAYAAWAGRKLPTEAQWEKAARGPDGMEFPWGAEWKPRALNYGDFRVKRNPDEADGHSFTAPVGSFLLGQSPYGCYDMAGNVAEWSRDRFDGTGELIVIRGGAWIHTDPDQFRTWRRDSARVSERGQSTGFRCVVEK